MKVPFPLPPPFITGCSGAAARRVRRTGVFYGVRASRAQLISGQRRANAAALQPSRAAIASAHSLLCPRPPPPTTNHGPRRSTTPGSIGPVRLAASSCLCALLLHPPGVINRAWCGAQPVFLRPEPQHWRLAGALLVASGRPRSGSSVGACLRQRCVLGPPTQLYCASYSAPSTLCLCTPAMPRSTEHRAQGLAATRRGDWVTQCPPLRCRQREALGHRD